MAGAVAGLPALAATRVFFLLHVLRVVAVYECFDFALSLSSFFLLNIYCLTSLTC